MLHEPRLADPGFSGDEEHTPPTADRVLQGGRQLCRFSVPADEGPPSLQPGRVPDLAHRNVSLDHDRRYRSRTADPASSAWNRESRDSADLIRAVETGDIDVTLIEIGQYETGPLKVRPLLNDPMVFVAPAVASEASLPMVSIADIAHLPTIGTRNAGCRQIIDDAFRQAPVSGSPGIPSAGRPWPFVEAAAEVCRDLDEQWTASHAA